MTEQFYPKADFWPEQLAGFGKHLLRQHVEKKALPPLSAEEALERATEVALEGPYYERKPLVPIVKRKKVGLFEDHPGHEGAGFSSFSVGKAVAELNPGAAQRTTPKGAYKVKVELGALAQRKVEAPPPYLYSPCW
jgi:hypothetical protein